RAIEVWCLDFLWCLNVGAWCFSLKLLWCLDVDAWCFYGRFFSLYNPGCGDENAWRTKPGATRHDHFQLDLLAAAHRLGQARHIRIDRVHVEGGRKSPEGRSISMQQRERDLTIVRSHTGHHDGATP